MAKAAGLNWGICGASTHARNHMAKAIQQQGGRIVALAASTRERAEAFCREFEIPEAIEGYDALLACPDIDAVYLPLLNTLHFKWALACARAGKHCLCEKPLVLTLREARELRQAFAQAGRRLMEAFMWRHHAHTLEMLSMVQEGAIGPLLRFHAMHGYRSAAQTGYRWEDLPGAGVLWDVGAYLVNGARLYFGAEPLAVSARVTPARPGAHVDCSAVGWLDFGENRLATVGCSFVSGYRQEFVLVGEKGSIQLTRPLTNLMGPTILRMEFDGKITMERQFEPVNPYERQVDHFTRLARDPSLAMWPAEDGVEQAAVMEALTISAEQGGVPQQPG